MNKRAGVVLVVILWVLVLVTVLALALAQRTRLDNAMRVAGADRVTARWLARAGVYRAMSEVSSDLGPTDTTTDTWYSHESALKEVSLEGGSFTVYAYRGAGGGASGDQAGYGIEDEASKVNLNTASREMLLALPGMTERMADGIVRWRTQETTSEAKAMSMSAESTAGKGVESEAVQSFWTLRQLALVEELMGQVFYGEDTNLSGVLESNEDDGDVSLPVDNGDGRLDRGLLSMVTVYSFEYNRDGLGRGRVNVNTADAAELQAELGLNPCQIKWIEENRGRGFGNIAGLLTDDMVLEGAAAKCTEEAGALPLDWGTFRRIADRITTRQAGVIRGRINVNTASAAVLGTLEGMTAKLAENVVQYRQTLGQGFTSVAEVLLTPGMTVGSFKQMAGQITVRSNAFTIRSCGQASRTGLRHYVEAVVARTDAGPTVIYWKETR